MTETLRNRLIIFGAVLLVALAFLLPTLTVVGKRITGGEPTASEFFKTSWISRPISLGLDLSGGVHLVYEVQAHDAVKSNLQTKLNSLRNELRKEKIAVTQARVSEQDEIEVTLLSDLVLEKSKSLIREGWSELELRNSKNDGGKVTLVYGISAQEVTRIEKSAVDQALETLRTRVDQFGVAEPVIQKVGEKRIMLQMPGVKDIQAVKDVVGKVAKLEFRMLPEPGSNAQTIRLKDREGGQIIAEDVVQMTGEIVADARAQPDLDRPAQYEVSLTLTTEGSRIFAEVTGANVHRRMAIVLDGEVYSSPEIQERIGGGRCSITGSFTIEQARQLAVVLRAGALPAPLKVLEERTVGPTLGAESIRAGVIAILVGFALIVVFLSIYYGKCGVLAAHTLLLNLVLMLAVLSAFGATLTLPGMAGLALTIGMAVDANVIIFERIREEIRNGSSRDVAVHAGFDKALSAIMDSNLTTLLSALILYYFGTGPIRGFAVTLSIGIVTTVYCATFASRLGFDYFSLESKRGLSI